jgi:acetamidase/formamidase
MERVVLSFSLHDDRRLTLPYAETPVGWLTFGFDERIDEAIAIAIEAMLAWLGQRYGLDRVTALGLASLVAEVRVT